MFRLIPNICIFYPNGTLPLCIFFLSTPSSSHLVVFPPPLCIDQSSPCSCEVICCVALKLCGPQPIWFYIEHHPGSLCTVTQTRPCKHTSPLSYIWEIKNIHDKLELYIKSNIWIIYAHIQPHYLDTLRYSHTRPQREALTLICRRRLLHTHTHDDLFMYTHSWHQWTAGSAIKEIH